MNHVQRALCVGALVLAACADQRDNANPDPTCHPFTGATPNGACAFPWPSSYYLVPDATTATGYRVNLPSAALPSGVGNVPYDTSWLNRLDGFSPAGSLLVDLQVRIDPSQLPTVAAPESSLTATSPVQLIRFDTGERVPLFAEVDLNAGNLEDQLLIIRPLVRLQPGTRYVVVLRELRDTQHRRIHNRPFDSLRGGFATTPSLARELLRYDEIFTRVQASGVPKEKLTLAWDFVTASDFQTLGDLLSMRDTGLVAWDEQQLGYTVEATTLDAGEEHLALELSGTYDVPSFLSDDTALGLLQRSPSGYPQYRATQKFPLLIHVPKCALEKTTPVPVMVFGHGLFGSAEGEMNSGYQKRVIDDLCMVQVGTDWIGLSINDAPNVATHVVPDFSQIPLVTDRLVQAQLNFLVLARLARYRLKDDPRLRVGDGANSRPLVDGNQVYYYGISQGGIEGGTLMALTPDLDHGALNVGAGIYSFMITRSVDFKMFKSFLDVTYPVVRDELLLFTLSQSYWDRSDPISWAPYTLKAPFMSLDGMTPLPARHLLMQEAEGDTQVPNLATRIVARTLGLPQLAPAVSDVYGIPTMPGPLDSAYTQWDIGPMPLPPDGDLLPAADNGAHGQIRKIPQLIEQLRRFFRPDGKVEATCDGPCTFPGFSE